MKRGSLFYLIILIACLPIGSAAHYIVGTVEDAKDLTEANNHTILLWNPAIGNIDNLTDIIGPFGNSGQNNNYSIDCELLNTPCSEGDVLTLKVINNGDNYLSGEKHYRCQS